MIYREAGNIIALLASGEIATKPTYGKGSWSKLRHPTDVMNIHFRSDGSIVAVLTINGSVYASSNYLNNLTSKVPEIENLFGKPVEIKHVFLYGMALIVATTDAIGIIPVHSIDSVDFLHRHRYLYSPGESRFIQQFEQGIDIIAFDQGFGLVKTSNGLLFRLGIFVMMAEYGHCYRYGRDWTCRKIDFADASNIKEIYTFSRYDVLLMQNGTAYVRHYSSDIELPFSLITAKDGSPIIKIIEICCGLAYITDTGKCYYVEDSSNYKINSDIGTNIIELSDPNVVFIEDIFTHDNGCTILHDGGQVRMIVVGKHTPIRQTAIRGPLSSETIVSVENLIYSYYITSAGGVYESIGLYITRDPFFDNNPIRIKSSSDHIRSAGNSIDD